MLSLLVSLGLVLCAACTSEEAGRSETTAQPAAAETGAGDSQLPDHPSVSEAGQAMREANGPVAACGLSGQVVQATVVFRGSDGAVTSVAVTGLEGLEGVEECVIAAIRAHVSLAPFARDEFRISFPYR